MTIIMTIAMLIGIAMLILGGMLLGAPEELYKFNESIIKLIYDINEYLNKKLFAFNSYFNNSIVSKDSAATYRLAIGAFYVIVGVGLVYSSYYYSQQGVLPPVVQAFITNIANHFKSPDAA